MKKVRIFVLEDNLFLREGISAMIDKQSDLKVVAALDTKEKLELKIREAKPDIVLIDLGLQRKNSLHVVRSAKKKFPDLRFIIMDLFPIHEDIYEFVKAGASGFILKDAGVSEFLKTIRSVFQGGKILPSHLMNSLFSQIVSEASFGSKKTTLISSVRMSKREREVISLVSDGLTNKEIGQNLHLSTQTVKSHVRNILEKLAVHNRIEISKYARSIKGINDKKDSASFD